jgi:cardiolipin synthase
MGAAGNSARKGRQLTEPARKIEEMVGQMPRVFELLVDSDRFWNRLKEDIASARQNIYVQTLSFEGDRVGRDLANELLDSSAVDKRVIVDIYTRHILSDKFRYSPKNWFDRDLHREVRETRAMIAELQSNGIGVRWVNPFGFLFHRIPERNHKKIIVVDDRVSYIGGINFSEHNFKWHDMMLRIEDVAIAEYLRDDFLVSWKGDHFGGRRQFDDIELFSFDGVTNKTAFEPILGLIDTAEDSIYVQSPYLCHPFIDNMRRASERGVGVTIVSPEQNNKKTLREYIKYEAARSGFDLRLYQPGMTHLKAMLIDEKYLVVGSTNFDCFSYHFHEEVVAVITDTDLIATFIEDVIRRDDECCRVLENPRVTFLGRLRNIEIRLVDWIMGLFNRRP